MVDGKVAVPIGTRVTGTVTDVISGSRGIGKTPMIGVRFSQLELENGQTIMITGDLVEEGKSERGQDTAKILGGVAAGAVLGHQVKTNNRGKVIGGLLGGAIGAVAAQKTGSEVTLAGGVDSDDLDRGAVHRHAARRASSDRIRALNRRAAREPRIGGS